MDQDNQIKTDSPAAEREIKPEVTDWLGIGQFVFSALAALLLLGGSLVSTLVLLIQASFSELAVNLGSDLSPYLFAAGMAAAGLLITPSAYYSGRRLFGKTAPRDLNWSRIVWIGYLAPLPLLMGIAAQNGTGWIRVLLPPAHALANTAGVFLLLDMARRKLPGGNARRFWGAFTSGLGLTPLVTFVLEIFILIGIALAWTLLLGAMPGFRQDLLQLASHLQNSSGSPQAIERAIGRFAARPGVLFTLFTYVALLIPIVEELLKPAAVWLLLKRKLQPWEGFVIGATSGAGYALFENLTIGAAPEAWTFVTITRLGTAAVHIFTAGAVGWGLASGFTEKKIFRMITAYLAAVLIHGVWNGLNILSAVGGFSAVRDRLGPVWTGLADYAPVALVLLAVGCLGGILRANSRFRRAIIAGSNSQREAEWKLSNS